MSKVAVQSTPQTQVLLSSAPACTIAADTIIIAAYASQSQLSQPDFELLCNDVDLSDLDLAALKSLAHTLGFGADLDEILRLPSAGLGNISAPTILLVGLGKAWAQAQDPNGDPVQLGDTPAGVLARAAGRAVRALADKHKAVLAFPTVAASDLETVACGAASGSYTWTGAQLSPAATLECITITSPLANTEAGNNVVTYANVLSGCLRLARDLVNEPPNRLTPHAFTQVARDLAIKNDLEIQVLDAAALQEAGFGGIVGVGQGSVHPPFLVRISWIPPQSKRHIALIGKGITFDSGGLSLKPAPSMPEMKSDMAGAASVLAAAVAASQLKLSVRVDAWLALAENMPTADAQRPSDIVTMYNGKTVEITNTDAEGRLVMADALARAIEDAPDAVLDVATLTGAQIVALGERVSAVMGTPSLREQVVKAAIASGEAFWAMPLPEHVGAGLKSPFAQLRNAIMGSRAAGMLSAGLFLREFVGDTPWVHLDIAGPAYNEHPAWGGVPQGGTGAGIATLVELLRM